MDSGIKSFKISPVNVTVSEEEVDVESEVT